MPSPRLRLAIFVTIAVAMLASAAGVWASRSSQGNEEVLIAGKKAYRTYCGQCHALAEALAAGFGGVGKFGQDGGPGFNELRVSAPLSIAAVTELFGGHELVLRKITWDQIKAVARFVEVATINHPMRAKMTDG